MGANIAAFSQVHGSFSFGKRKRQTRGGMYDRFLKNFNRFFILKYVYKCLVFIIRNTRIKFLILIKCLMGRRLNSANLYYILT